MANAQTAFQPVLNGFQFVNRFELSFPIKYTLPLVGRVDLSNVVFGLCGGMCFAALDYFHLGKPIPEFKQVDEIDGRLFAYLSQRQLDSLKIPVLLKVVEWMLLEDDDLARRMTRTEIPKLRRSLDQGQPAVLLLIRVQGLGNPTLNHQVVATGYEVSSDGKSMTMAIYDPNHPCEDVSITVSLSSRKFNIRQSSGEALRGFFLVPYAPSRTVPQLEEADLGGVAFDTSGFQLQWPVDSRIVNQYFAENPENYKGFGLPGHEGLDLFALTGANIYACADGEVVEAGTRPKSHPYGVQIRIKHTFGSEVYETVYAHLQEVHVKVGQHVKAGEKIGLADNTGNSFGSHLHLTLKKEGAKTPGYPAGIIDPWPYLKAASTPITVPPPSPSGITVYTFGQTNLRAQPSAAAELLASLPAGEALAVLGNAAEIQSKIGKQDQWLQVKTASGLVGFIAAWLVTSTKQEAFPPSGVIVYPFESVNLRSGPGTNFELLASLDSTQPLTVLGDPTTARARVGLQNEWLQVQTQSGQRGFVAAWLVHLTGQLPPSTGLTVYPFESVNVRARPSTDANILTVAVAGDALTVLGDKTQVQGLIGKQDQWINVQTPAKIAGYVAAWLVTTARTQPKSDATKFITVYPTTDLNIRAQPSANAPRLSGAVKNEPLTVLETDVNAAQRKLGKQDFWMYVQKSDGTRGWAAAWFLSSSKS